MNKKELAALLSCSLPTLAAWIDRYPDFPVRERGTNGREWRFDAHDVIAFLAARREAEQRDAEERAAFLEQFALPGVASASQDAPEGVKPAELLALARLRALERREHLESSLLVPTSDVRMALTAAFGKLNRFLASTLQQMARKHGWSDAQLRDAQAMFAEAQRGFVRDAANFAPEDGDLFDAAPALSDPPAG